MSNYSLSLVQDIMSNYVLHISDLHIVSLVRRLDVLSILLFLTRISVTYIWQGHGVKRCPFSNGYY